MGWVNQAVEFVSHTPVGKFFVRGAEEEGEHAVVSAVGKATTRQAGKFAVKKAEERSVTSFGRNFIPEAVRDTAKLGTKEASTKLRSEVIKIGQEIEELWEHFGQGVTITAEALAKFAHENPAIHHLLEHFAHNAHEITHLAPLAKIAPHLANVLGMLQSLGVKQTAKLTAHSLTEVGGKGLGNVSKGAQKALDAFKKIKQ